MVLEAAQIERHPADETTESQLTTQANRVLAPHRVTDLERQRREIASINIDLPDEAVEQFGHTDIEGYLRHYHDRMVCAAIEESKHTVFSQAEVTLDRALAGDWEAAKNDLLHALHLFDHVHRDTIPPEQQQQREYPPTRDDSLRDRSLARTSHSSQAPSSSEMLYATDRYGRVMDLWSRSHNRAQFPLLQEMSGAARDVATKSLEGDDSAQGDVLRVWHLLARQVQEGQPGVTQDCYRKAYEDRDESLQCHLASGSVAYLEERMMETVSQGSRPSRAAASAMPLGPGLGQHPIREYINTNQRDLTEEHHDVCSETLWRGTPLWVEVFYLLRCGHWREAPGLLGEFADSLPEGPDQKSIRATATALAALGDLALATRSGGWRRAEAFDTVLREVQTREVVHAVGLCQQAAEQLETLQESNEEGAVDPFKLAVLNLAGQYDPELPTKLDSGILIDDVKDYIWHSLLFVIGQPLAAAGAELRRLDPPQPSIWPMVADVCFEWGWEVIDNHPPHGKPYRFAEVLVLCQQYEAAVDYLVAHGDEASPFSFLHDGVHFALVCYHYGLLRVCDTPYIEWAPPSAAGPLVDPFEGDGLVLVRSHFRPGDGGDADATARPLTVNAARMAFLLSEFVRHCVGIPLPDSMHGRADAEDGLLGIMQDADERERVRDMLQHASEVSIERAANYCASLHRAEDSITRRRLLRSLLCLDARVQTILLGTVSSQFLPQKQGLLRPEATIVPEDEMIRIVEDAGWQCCEEQRLEEAMYLFCRANASGKVLGILHDALRRCIQEEPHSADAAFWESRAAAFVESPLAQSNGRGAVSAVDVRRIRMSQSSDGSHHSFEDRLFACSMLVELLRVCRDAREANATDALERVDRIQVQDRFPLVPRHPGPDAWRGVTRCHPSVQAVYGTVLCYVLQALKQLHDRERDNGSLDVAASCRDRIALLASLNHPRLAQVVDPQSAHYIARFQHGVM